MRPEPLNHSRLQPGDFVGQIRSDDLVYFCLNVGDADAQVVLLPTSPDGHRRVIVVDAGVFGKVPDLLAALEGHGLVSFADPEVATVALVVATHPHHDHIAGMAELLNHFGDHVAEFWEPAFFYTSASYSNMMRAVASLPDLVYTQPTSGLRRFLGAVALTVLSPSIHLRNRFDTYGVEINDASISLRFEHPARAIADQGAVAGRANRMAGTTSSTLLLGADAQTLSWSFVATDFPYLAESKSDAARAIAAATGGRDLLSTDVLKVSHHASKHGVNLELLERMNPGVTLVSSTANGPAYGFPHTVTQELIREAKDPVAGSPDPTTGQPRDHKPDQDLGIFYTSDVTTAPGEPEAGSFGIILKGRRRQVWRFGDTPVEAVDLTSAARWS